MVNEIYAQVESGRQHSKVTQDVLQIMSQRCFMLTGATNHIDIKFYICEREDLGSYYQT